MKTIRRWLRRGEFPERKPPHARLAWTSGRKVLRFFSNPATKTLYHQIVTRLAA